MGYAVFCSRNPCGSVGGRWFYGGTWSYTKPSLGARININSAFKIKESKYKGHTDCGCVFEVVEISEQHG